MDGNELFRVKLAKIEKDRADAHIAAVDALVEAIVEEYQFAIPINDRPTRIIGNIIVGNIEKNLVAPKEPVVALAMAHLRSIVTHTRHPTKLYLHLEPQDTGNTILEFGMEDGAEILEDWTLPTKEQAYQEQITDLRNPGKKDRKRKRENAVEETDAVASLNVLKRPVSLLDEVMKLPLAKKHKPADE
jgi:hypothetical protein